MIAAVVVVETVCTDGVSAVPASSLIAAGATTGAIFASAMLIISALKDKLGGFMENIMKYLSLGIGVLIVFGTVFFMILLNRQYRTVRKLYAKGQYQKCKEKIEFLKRIAINKVDKQFLICYYVGILLAENQDKIALEGLNKITYKRFLNIKYFWSCFIYIKKNEIDKANQMFMEYKKAKGINENDLQILTNLINKKNNPETIMDASLVDKIKHPKVLEYYKQTLNE